MKRILALTTFLLFCMVICQKADAQYSVDYSTYNAAVPGYSPSFDDDFRQMRYNIDPALRYRVDDWSQYVPAVVLVGLKAAGYEGRTSWGRMLVSDAFSGAIMAGLVNGLKYSVRRPRPDGSARNSFPSGHTATAFMTAAMLHKEYGWRSQWFSIGGYTVAALTGVSRVLNNRHWVTDVMAGAAIGISSVHLGYFLADLIFKDRYISEAYGTPDMFGYDPEHKYYEAGLFFARRFVLGNKADKEAGLLPFRGGVSGISLLIPLIPQTGVAFRGSVNSLSFKGGDTGQYMSMNMYNVLAGGYWVYPFPKYIEFDLKVMIGYAWHRAGNGLDMLGEAGIALRAGENFRIKAFAEYETFSFSRQKPFVNSFLLGLSSSVCW